jgi:hypothetical protein
MRSTCNIMTDTLAVQQKPTWSSPQNLKDDTIIDAALWNRIVSSIGSVGYLNSVTNKRARCNIIVAEWTQTIQPSVLATANSTIIKFSSTSNSRYFKPRSGQIILPDQTPCLLIWRMWFYGETSATSYNQRTTLRKAYKTGNSQVIKYQEVAAHFNRKFDADQVVMSASYAVVSNVSTDRYYITAAHGFNTAIATRGHCHLIINPGMV